MTEEEPLTSETEDRLDEQFAEYLESLEESDSKDTKPFVACSPELAQTMAAHEELGRLVAPLRDLAVTEAYEGSHATPLSPGTVIGDYEIIEEIGRGGMGVVYKARNRKFNLLAALKMISSGTKASEAERTRFLAEVEHQGNLNHPNIVSVTGGGEYEGHLYFTMTLIERKDGKASLEQHLDRFKNDHVAAVKLMEKVALAVRYANQRGILHRDLKPGNVLLDEEGNPHVTDFGLAKQLSDREEWVDGPETQNVPTAACSMLAGTVSYMSPEQAKGEKYLTVRSDVYGLGAILYELLTGVPPCKEDNFEEAWKRAIENNIPRPRSLNPSINTDLEAVCLQCLKKDPDSRYESGKHLAENLDRLQNHKRPDKVKWPLWKHVWSCVLRNPVATTLILLASLLAGFGGQEWLKNLRNEQRLAAEQKATLDSTQYVAGLVASILQNRIEDLKQAVDEASEKLENSDDLINRVEQAIEIKPEQMTTLDPFPDLDQFVRELVNSRKDSTGEPIFVTAAYFNHEGTMLAHSYEHDNKRENVVRKNFSYRDYFQGAMFDNRDPNGSGVYVSKLYESLSEGYYKIGFSRAIYSKNHPEEIIGVLYASIKTSKTMGISSLKDHKYNTVLIGPGDPRAPKDKKALPDHVVLLHPSYSENAARNPDEDTEVVAFPKIQLEAFKDGKCDDYHDPVGEFLSSYEGRFLAGSAPVKGTKFTVIIQVKYDTVFTKYDNELPNN